MKKTTLVVVVTAVIVIMTFFVFRTKQSHAAGLNFDGITLSSLATSQGTMLLLFDKNDGRVYIYKNEKHDEIKCVEILQLSGLGQPIKIIFKDDIAKVMNLF